MVRRSRRRPYRRIALALLIPGALLILASIPQFFFGIPVSEGVAPAGLSLGPLLVIGGTVLYFSEKPRRGERSHDDSATFRWLDVGQ
ncbi:hypothetical protein [Microbacterium sp. 1.5R]|uniref:hypothetical protein n=1 Tax=Microbacterium sp. 1.5R TaxID=1916917 RepID=UPI0011A2B03D|nr:hypothetical protein [Microbacterium sp. 1.5R]